jgi:hypothetical protein
VNYPVNQLTQSDNQLQSEGKFTDSITFEVAGFYIEDRAVKAWLNYNRLVFVWVGGNGQAFITGEENGYKIADFKDSTAGSSAQWTFTANTTYNNYGVSSEYLGKISEATVCGDYTQFDCIVGDYTGFIP